MKAELARDLAAIGVEVHAGERAGAERQHARLPLGERETRAIAIEHPQVREQMVAEVHRLGALQVRVAGHRPVTVLLGARAAAWPSARAAARCASAARARVYIARSVATWSLRERAVCRRPPTGPTISVSRRSTAMWTSSSSGRNANSPLAQLALDVVEPAQQRLGVGVGDDAAGGEHAGVRARLGDVLRPQPPVEGDRRVQALEVGVLGLGEAGHRAPVYEAANAGSERPATRRSRPGRSRPRRQLARCMSQPSYLSRTAGRAEEARGRAATVGVASKGGGSTQIRPSATPSRTRRGDAVCEGTAHVEDR